jgi:hypothetical protein
MEYTMPRQSFRIAGFFLLGAAALMAQASKNNEEQVQLVAFNTPTTARYPVTTEIGPNPKPRISSSNQASQHETGELRAAQSSTIPLLGPALMPSRSLPVKLDLAIVKEHTASSRPWFTAGPDALPTAIRLDPKFDPPTRQYGAAPAAVRFTFGRK